MDKENKNLVVLFLLLLTLAFSVFAFRQIQVWQKRAEEGPLEVNFSPAPQDPLRRTWTNFSQGGEEKTPMLKPAAKEIKALQPEYIRIDHLFDFYEILKKDAQGNLVYDFSDLDQRIKEIVDLGATPFLSLSYFPRLISPDPNAFPDSLDLWKILIEKTIQRYSGKADKNIADIYYEVWNEPDLFGKMNPETYFSLYQASVTAANNCHNCLPFKIGGPAITTFNPKSEWLTHFLTLAAQNQTRLDFISWHSYQVNPAKTAVEAESLKKLVEKINLANQPELIVSEWGSTPEVSSLHDSYFDASHTLATIAKTDNILNRLFAFELKDGPSPEQKQFWGRWGLLTNEKFGLTPKPRYYTFLYLNQLLLYRLNFLASSADLQAIGSTDGNKNFVLIIARTDNTTKPRPTILRLLKPPTGTYQAQLYSLDSLHNPLLSLSVDISFSDGNLIVNFPTQPNGVYLVKISRSP